MLNFSSAELDAFLALVVYPAARILALVSAAPIFNNRTVPANIRLGIGLLAALAIVPGLDAAPAPQVGSGLGLVVLLYNILIGLAIGFVIRLIFAAVDLAGELIGLQMSLSFALFFDPEAGAQTPVVSEFLGLLVTLLFLAIDGHLLLLDVIARSFEWLPAGGADLKADGWAVIARLGGSIYATGLLLALPLVAMLLVTNIALGVLTRAAPQLNLFSVGFPITLSVGLIALNIAMNTFVPALRWLFEQGFEKIDTLLRAMV